jgi:hypothetical protein
VGKSLLRVRRWRCRYIVKGLDGLLKDAARTPGRKPLTAETIKRIVHMTLHEKPPNATQWSARSMAEGGGHLLHQRAADLARASAPRKKSSRM